ncbi:hypothetical protein [Alkalimarinus coralli]|uniref:DUF7738 domain-containing protein n=1 Tax=Alkalimarinus coralli TaxID=2935863 RepID=UPI00202AE122|nr:hypothetical protein [Alkalimarinus coralli]
MNKLPNKSAIPWLVSLCISLSGCYGEPQSSEKRLNSNHQFTFNGCDIRYNGKPLILGDPIDDWVTVLGPYDRMSSTANDVYVYDDMGVTLYAHPNTSVIISLTLILNEEKEMMQWTRDRLVAKKRDRERSDLDPNSTYFKGLDFSIEFDENVLASKPKQTFKQGFTIDDVIFDENFERNRVNPDRLKKHSDAPRFGRSYLPTIFSAGKSCDYGELLYQFRTLSTDLKKLHRFSVSKKTL